MPYIDGEQRAQLDPAIYLMVKGLINSQWVGDLPTTEEVAGRLNYTITRLIVDTLFRCGPRYHLISTAIGVLETCKLEMYRRLAAPYEDKKAEENGDVYAS